MKRLLLTLLVLLSLPSQASAYRTSRDLPEFASSAQQRVAWDLTDSANVAFVVTTEGNLIQTRPLIDVASVIVAYDQAFEALDCARLGVSAIVASYSSEGSLGNGINEIRLLDAYHWSRLEFEPGLMAFTDVRYEEGADGVARIVEADILVNEGSFDFAGDLDSGGSPLRDGHAVLGHELLHAFGVLHPCEADGSGGAPLCSADSSFSSRLMWPDYSPATQQAMSPDERLAICFLYPRYHCTTACAADKPCVDGTCGSLCGQNACASNEICESDRCQASCEDVLCAEGQVCVEGACVARCASGTVCAPGEVCGGTVPENECGAASCLGEAPGFCVRCDDVASCPDGTACVGAESGYGTCRASDGRLGSACADDADCLVPGRCVGGSCRLRWGHDGDPCTMPSDCIGDRCVDSHCTSPCTVADECELERAECASGLCVHPLGSFGDVCETGDDCTSLLCLEEQRSGVSVCTRRCAVAEHDCPGGFECDDIDGRTVCRPRPFESGGNCAISPQESSQYSPWIGVILFVSVWRIMRRKAAS